jgi:hypothetical protein
VALELALAVLATACGAPEARETVPRFAVFERSFQHAGECDNPYVEIEAHVELVEPNGETTRCVPMFWDGGSTWKFRFSPDEVGTWRWRTESADGGLRGHGGAFRAIPSDRKGSIRAMRAHPLHFERQDGSPFWFLGDTAWALYTDSAAEEHDRSAVTMYIAARAAQGFNVIHSMLMSEAGWGNRGGPPFEDIGAERINPGYWREVDRRLEYLNHRGLVGGLALAWGDKRGVEPFAWKRLRTLDARKRYARYIAARYGAFDVYFIVSGEWHAEVGTTPGATEDGVKRRFIEIGDALHASDPHDRMIAIHPMTSHGSVREFAGTSWMAFGDYQQNYRRLHERVLASRGASRPVVNSEYGYYLRDRDGDGLVDKPNSLDVDMMRHATWDIVMAGGYVVTGFGTTYFGGNRDPGPFRVDAEKNDPWEEDIQHIRTLFTSLPWHALAPADGRIEADVPRGEDRTKRVRRGARTATVPAPPAVAYWMLADPGRTCVAYVRGHEGPFALDLGEEAPGDAGAFHLRQYDPRTGRFDDLGRRARVRRLSYRPPDERDWVLLVERIR